MFGARPCLDGFLRAIHISCIFSLETERDAFVSALSKLTFLDNYREIGEKNIKSIRLDKAKMLGSGAKPDFAFLQDHSQSSSPRTAAQKLKHFETMNSLAIAEAIDEVSREEIEHATPPRMFSLQKLVEIADLNMD
eukprot:gene6181-63485_t